MKNVLILVLGLLLGAGGMAAAVKFCPEAQKYLVTSCHCKDCHCGKDCKCANGKCACPNCDKCACATGGPCACVNCTCPNCACEKCKGKAPAAKKPACCEDHK